MNKGKFELLILKVLLALVLVVHSMYIFKGIILSADSIRYLYAAKTFPNPKHLINNEFFSVQPLLYPIFLKIIHIFEGSNLGIVFSFVHVGLYLLTMLFAFRIIDFFAAKNEIVNYFGKLTIACSYGILYVYGFLLSETLFIPLFAAALYFLARYHLEKKPEHFYAYLLVSGLLPVTRYIGVFLLVFNFIYLLYLLHKRRLTVFIALAFILSFLPFAANLVFNYVESGQLTGGDRGEGMHSFGQNFLESIITVIKAFPVPLWDAFEVMQKRVIIGVIAVLIGLVAIIVLLRKANAQVRWKSHLFNYSLLLIGISFLYLLALSYTATYTAFDPIDVRLIAPALIPVFLIIVLFILQVEFRRMNVVLVVLAIFFAGFAGVRMRNGFKSKGERAIALPSGLYYRKYYSHDEIFSQVKAEMKKGNRKIFTNDPYRLMNFTGLYSDFLPERNYYSSPTKKHSEQEARQIVSSESAMIVIYEEPNFDTERFYPAHIYTSGKAVVYKNDSVSFYK